VKRDFLTLADRTEAEYRALFDRAHALKASRQRKEVVTTLAGRHLVLVFEKASTRTHLSFEAAMYQLGGTVSTITSASFCLGMSLIPTSLLGANSFPSTFTVKE